MPRLLRASLVLAIALAPAACGSDEEKSQPGGGARDRTATTQRPATTSAPARQDTRGAPPATCRAVREPAPKPAQDLPAPRGRLNRERTYRAVVDTSCGRFTITLDVQRAPRTAASFVHLARRGLYDGLAFHRVVPGFVIQGGDPRGTGQGGPGYKVVEAPPDDLRYERGTVAMAKTATEEPGTSGSQFFVVVGPDAQLPPEYALVGKVTQGFDTVQRIAAIPLDAGNPNPDRRERPARPVVIQTVTINESR